MRNKKEPNCYCAYCGRGLRRKPYRVNRIPNQYCNRECYFKLLDKTRTGNLKAICDNCGSNIIGLPEQRLKRNKHFFCSRECWRQSQIKRLTINCANCGNNLEIHPSTHKKDVGNFCDMQCYGAWRKKNFKGKKNPNWRHGLAGKTNNIDYGPNWRRQRKAAIQRDGGCCRRCAATESLNGYALDVHHITPFRKFDYVRGENDNYKQANELSNLITLCRECHALVENAKVSLTALIPTQQSSLLAA